MFSVVIDFFETATIRLELAVHKALNTHKKTLVSENVHHRNLGLVVLDLRVLDEGWLGAGHESVGLGPIIEIWGWSCRLLQVLASSNCRCSVYMGVVTSGKRATTL